ncbi:MAG: hypothetical protein ACKOEI_12930 [Chthoniobacterales bacterium]
MGRRARSTPPAGLLIAALAVLLLLIAGGGYFLGGSGAPYRTAPEFPVEEYLANSSSLRGNSYRLTGAVLNSIAWSQESGRLISVEPTGSDSPIPVVVPAELGEVNIQKGQRFHFLVEVREKGILYARDLTKS